MSQLAHTARGAVSNVRDLLAGRSSRAGDWPVDEFVAAKADTTVRVVLLPATKPRLSA